MQKKRARFFFIALFATTYVLLNAYISQAVSPLFSGVVYANDKKATIDFLKKIMRQPEFNTQFSLYTAQYGKGIDSAVFSEKVDSQKKIIYYTELLKKNPHSRDVLIKLALLYRSMGDVNKSNAYYQNALQIDPELLPLQNY